MEKEIWYTALFVVDPTELIQKFIPKHNKVLAHHSTIDFKPGSLEDIVPGRKVNIKIIGRAHDKKGDALLVENKKSKNVFPHITLSCAEGVRPVYSNELLERADEEGSTEYFEPFFVEAIEGYETIDGEVNPDIIKSQKSLK